MCCMSGTFEPLVTAEDTASIMIRQDSKKSCFVFISLFNCSDVIVSS